MTKRQLLREEKKQLWHNHINSCKERGLGPTAYCLENNLKRATFYYWKKRFNEEALSPISFVPIKINLQPIQKEPSAGISMLHRTVPTPIIR